jgi:hypothetical protein
MKIIIAFWDIALCSLVEVDQRFRVAYWPYHLGDGHLDDEDRLLQ